MIFRVSHQTLYRYAQPASESYAEVRLCPLSSPTQTVRHRHLRITPRTRVGFYNDFFGNTVEFFSIPKRHDSLSVHATAEVETVPVAMPSVASTLSVAEARQILSDRAEQHYIFLRPSPLVPLHSVLSPLRTDFLKARQPLDEALLSVNHWIFTHFRYHPGTTDISTPLSRVITKRAGVCQDFAHLLLSILRSYGIPARYVSGYIEAHDPETTAPQLVGALASHAWVEAYIPGGHWVGLDPTNDQIAGERHVRLAVGRDYLDVAPLTGTYKGASDQRLKVIVSVKRKKS